MLFSATFVLVCIVIVGLLFDFVNGFHDSANSIATVVATRAMSPRSAVLMAAVLDFVGALSFEAVAKTISKGLVDPLLINDQRLILSALLGAIAWNLLTWWWGLPSSSSHALVGGLCGSALVCRGVHAVLWSNVANKVVWPGLLSPLAGVIVGYLLMVSLYWLVRTWHPTRVRSLFMGGQVVSSAALSFAHGTSDAQKVMGIITLALVAGGKQQAFDIPAWVKLSCATMMCLGTSAGGWRIIRTMGTKVSKLSPAQGFAAQATGAILLFGTAALGLPVSTTHVISASIMGVGASKRFSAVRWTVAGNILGAWFITVPASAVVAALTFEILQIFVPAP